MHERQYKCTPCSPTVIHVPHASVYIPDKEKNFLVQEMPEQELLRMTDHYCNDLFDCKHEILQFPYTGELDIDDKRMLFDVTDTAREKTLLFPGLYKTCLYQHKDILFLSAEL